MTDHLSRRLLAVVAAGTACLVGTTALTAAPAVPAPGTRSAAVDGDSATGRACLTRIAQGTASSRRERAFDAASATFGVPRAVLLGVSYLESRWDDYGGAPSAAGGYGPMHLTNVTVADQGDAKGDGESRTSSAGPRSLHTWRWAAELTGLRPAALRFRDAANICGGAAVLAAYQLDAGRPVGTGTPMGSWFDAVRQYNSFADTDDSASFARLVFTRIREGASRTTNDGQRIRLPAHPAVRIPAAAPRAETGVDCPAALGCEWIPAPYSWNDPHDPTAYGNHDLANRPHNLDIDYIVIHGTEGEWDHVLDLAQDRRYTASWNYTVRSSDGQIAQHLDARNVGWHAGNWYINMHSIGIEHEGFAAHGARWYTEAMYENSAELVKYLARKYGVPLDRAHIIGHDQVPAPDPTYVAGMHWDPGPYWNWEHYMQLLGAPISKSAAPHRKADGWAGSYVVAPGFRGNEQRVTGCSVATPQAPCRTQATNFVYVRTRPNPGAPLVPDVGLHPDAPHNSTAFVSDIGARLNAGQRVVVERRVHRWLKIWYLGRPGWVPSPRKAPNLLPVRASTISPAPGKTSVAVYGRAYPGAAAYPAAIEPQPITPLQYTIPAGQEYVLAQRAVPTDYYYAKSFDDSIPGDHTVVRDGFKYHEIWLGHRLAYVKAADVRIKQAGR